LKFSFLISFSECEFVNSQYSIFQISIFCKSICISLCILNNWWNNFSSWIILKFCLKQNPQRDHFRFPKLHPTLTAMKDPSGILWKISASPLDRSRRSLCSKQRSTNRPLKSIDDWSIRRWHPNADGYSTCHSSAFSLLLLFLPLPLASLFFRAAEDEKRTRFWRRRTTSSSFSRTTRSDRLIGGCTLLRFAFWIRSPAFLSYSSVLKQSKRNHTFDKKKYSRIKFWTRI